MTYLSSFSIIDFDECSENNGGCQHYCRNTYGSYLCSCRNGYTLNNDQHNCTETTCKFEITSSYGVVYSPNYPDEYPRNMYCYWHFIVTPGHRVKLIFNEFDLEDHQVILFFLNLLYIKVIVLNMKLKNENFFIGMHL